MAAEALANERLLEIEQLRAREQSAALQLDVLRESREGLSRAVAELEARMRKELQKSDKLKKQFERALQDAAVAKAAEAAALTDASSAADDYATTRVQMQEALLRLRRTEDELSELKVKQEEAELAHHTLTMERDSSLAMLAEARTMIAELDEARENIQKQLEQAKMALVDEREARRAKESERLAALDAAEKATNRMEAALKQLEKMREDSGDMFTRGLHAEEMMAKAEARAKQLEKDLADERAKCEVLASDLAKGSKRLVELRDAVGECTASLLVAGDRADPIRVHNEGVINQIIEALAVSGAEVTKFQWASRKRFGGGETDEADGAEGGGTSERGVLGSGKELEELSLSDALAAISTALSDPASATEVPVAARTVAAAAEATNVSTAKAQAAADGVLAPFASRDDKEVKYSVQPLAVSSPRKLAAVRETQRTSAQMLMDSMVRLGDAAKLQRRSLQIRMRELAAKLAHRGDASIVREEIVRELKALADNDSPVLPVSPTEAAQYTTLPRSESRSPNHSEPLPSPGGSRTSRAGSIRPV